MRNIYWLILTLSMPSAAVAQNNLKSIVYLSPLDLWVIASALLIGLLATVARAIEEDKLPAAESQGRDGENKFVLVSFTALHGFGSYLLVGLVLGIIASLTLPYSTAMTLSGAAILLFVMALSLLDVAQWQTISDTRRTKFYASLPTGLLLVLLVSILVIAILLYVFEYDVVVSDFQLISGIAMGLALGVYCGRVLLRSMNLSTVSVSQGKVIRCLAGVAMIALSIFVVGRIPQVPVIFFWSVFLIVVAVYCGATSRLKQSVAGGSQILKGSGLVVLIFGVIGLASASFGYRNISEPFANLSAFVSSNGQFGTDEIASKSTSVFSHVNSMGEFDQILIEARQAEQPVMIDFYAEWCLDCKRMDRTTFKDPSIVTTLNHSFKSIKVDVTDPNGEFSRAIRKRYQVFGPPALLFFDSKGDLSPSSPAYGYLDVEELTTLLTQIQ